jgi:hypothetical protein
MFIKIKKNWIFLYYLSVFHVEKLPKKQVMFIKLNKKEFYLLAGIHVSRPVIRKKIPKKEKKEPIVSDY